LSEIVLIRPPMVLSRYSLSTSATPPLALAYLAGMLGAEGYDVQAIDAIGEDINRFTPIDGTVGVAQGLDADAIVDRIDPDAKIIGFSAMFSCSWTLDKRILTAIRQRFPDALIIAGGEHITACADYVLADCPALDMCVKGEGEQSLLEIVRAYFSGTSPFAVEGIVWRKDGKVIDNPGRPRIRDIDTIPDPDWDRLPIEVYLDGGFGHGVNLGRSMPLLATRGCPYQCTFCSSPFMWTTRWVARSPAMVFAEIEKYLDKYGATNFDLYDLTAIVKKSWIIEFCDLILASGRRFTWQLPSGTRSEALDEEALDKLWRSGCRNMNYAPESGSVEVLARIKKKVTPDKLLDSLSHAVARGISVKINMIFAFPEDTPAETWQSFLFGMKCAWLGAQDSTFIPYVPYPGSELYNKLAESGDIPPMSDSYFNSLIPFSDLQFAKSFNRHFSDKQLVWLRFAYLAMFYGAMFIRRPWRAAKIVTNLITGKQESRGEEILRNLFHRRRQLKA